MVGIAFVLITNCESIYIGAFCVAFFSISMPYNTLIVGIDYVGNLPINLLNGDDYNLISNTNSKYSPISAPHNGEDMRKCP